MDFKSIVKETIEKSFVNIIGQKYRIYVEHYGLGDNPQAITSATENFLRGIKKSMEATEIVLKKVDEELE